MNIAIRSQKIMKEARILYHDIGEKKVIVYDNDLMITITKTQDSEQCTQTEQSRP